MTIGSQSGVLEPPRGRGTGGSAGYGFDHERLARSNLITESARARRHGGLEQRGAACP